MRPLFFIDVDGTLYGPSGVPECAWQALARAREQGVNLALCTGRPGLGQTLTYAQRVNPHGLHIFEAGAVVANAQGQAVHSLSLEAEVYRELLNLGREMGVSLEAYTVGGYFVEQKSPELKAHQEMLGISPSQRDLAQLASVVRFQFLVPREQSPGILETLKTYPVQIHAATSPGLPEIDFLSLIHPATSKEVAAEFVAGKQGLELKSAAMVGDGAGDLALIQAAGLGIAMGNAPAAVRNSAHRVVARVEDCGLAEAIALVLEN